MTALEYIQDQEIKFYDNKGNLPNERTYRSYKGAILGSLFYGDLGWYKNTVLYKGMTPNDFYEYRHTKEWFELPLLNPSDFPTTL